MSSQYARHVLLAYFGYEHSDQVDWNNIVDY
ncbi:hypothetical protein RO3G_05151 [Rhizopus delemar RA 99-880]|uniref:Uncharacterized protein n=1 Tax=Rhizopus delemar (strain RA 99-880 / ATCC MYA-4621 / FGSC 9543 / NRRL 43880) TaxID=246409 RepID=I1BW66_RHIO9|nr:hypothetical protein RO3G_05151 [Rhizopus delemar RA 99-880]|eukprot:EIE80446.1 hypothetical protein RO3G_05151 [Rhizopus delemar RA 99-880]